MIKIRKKVASKTQTILNEVRGEMHRNPPKIVAHTRAKYGHDKAQEQTVAIILNKARRKGARITRRSRSR